MLALEPIERIETPKSTQALPNLTFAVLLHGAIAFLVFLPFFLKGYIPLWSTDNLYGSYPVIFYSAQSLSQGFSGWLPYYLTGVDFAGSINNMMYSLLLWPAYLLPTAFFWVAIGWIQFACLWSIGGLAFLFARRVLQDNTWAFFSSIIFQLSHQVLFAFQTFPTPCLQIFFLIGCHGIWSLGDRQPLFPIFLLVTSFLGLILSGHLVYGAHLSFALFILFFYRCASSLKNWSSHGPVMIFFVSFIVAVLIGSIRWLPFSISVFEGSRFAQQVIISDHLPRLHRAVHLFIPEIFGLTNPILNSFGEAAIKGYGENIHEFFHYYGVLGAFFLGLAFLDPCVKGEKFWKILSFFYLAYAAGLMPFAFLVNLFFYPIQHGGILLASPLAFSILMGHAGKKIAADLSNVAATASHPRRTSTADLQTMGLCFLMICLTLLYAMVIWYSGWKSAPSAPMIFKGVLGIGAFVGLFFYVKREDFGAFDRGFKFGLAVFAICLLLIFAYTVPSPSFKYSELYYFTAITHWIAVGALSLIGLSLLAWPERWNFKIIFLSSFVYGLTVLFPFTEATEYVFFVQPGAEENHRGLWMGVSRLLTVFVVFALLLKQRSQGRIIPSHFARICCLIVFVELLPVFRQSSYTICRPFLKVKDGSLYQAGFQKQNLDLKNYRVNFPHQLIPPQSAYFPEAGKEELSNIPIVQKIPYYGGVDGQTPQKEVRFIETLSGAPPTRIGIAANSTDDRFLQLVGCRYDFRTGKLEERPHALSRFMFFSNYEVKKEGEETLERLKDPSFNPAETLIVAEDPRIPSSSGTSFSLPYTARRDDALELQLKTDKAGLLLFNDSFHSGWKAFIDGKAVPILRANFKFMSVALPTGVHHLEFRFRPNAVKNAAILAGLGLVLLFVFVFSLRNRFRMVEHYDRS